jgi:hypothetical protein
MKKSSIIVALLVMISVAITAAFSDKVSIKGFVLSVYSTALNGNKSQTQEIGAQSANGSIVIDIIGAGKVVNTGRGNTFQRTRDATTDEISGLSFSVTQDLTYSSKLMASGVKVGQAVSVPTSYRYYITQKSGSDVYFTTDGGCYGGQGISVTAGGITTCGAGINISNEGQGGSEDDIHNPFEGAVQGPAATLPQYNNSVVTAQFQKILLDVSTDTSTSILDSQVYTYQGKSYLLVSVSAGYRLDANKVRISRYKIYTFDISQPLSPKLLKTTDIDGGYNYSFSKSGWIVLDNYKYIIAFEKIFSFDPSGSLTVVREVMSLTCALGRVTYCPPDNIAVPLSLFKVGDKVYLAAYAKNNTTLYPNNDFNTEEGVWQEGSGDNKTLMYTNAILFFDVTSGNFNIGKSQIISGYRTKAVTSFDWTERITGPDGDRSKPFIINTGGKTYFGMSLSWGVHSLHNNSANLVVLDVSNISNPVVVADGSLSWEVAKIFNQVWDLTRLEKTYLDYRTSFTTIVDPASNTAVHFYSDNIASLALFTPVFGPFQGENLNKTRVRDIIMGDTLSGSSPIFSEMNGTRTVICEQIGGDEGVGASRCGTRVSKTNTINFGSLIAYKSGLVVSSAGKTAVISNNQIAFSDTSAEFLKYKDLPANARFSSAAIVSAGNKTFAVYANQLQHLEVVKITVSSTLQGTEGGGSGGDTTVVTPPTKTTFSFESLLRIFRRTLGK